MPKPSTAAEQIRARYPEIWRRFSNLAEACHDAGSARREDPQLGEVGNRRRRRYRGWNPLRRAARSRSRVTPQEMEHVVLLSITTIRLPAAGRAFTWIHDKAE